MNARGVLLAGGAVLASALAGWAIPAQAEADAPTDNAIIEQARTNAVKAVKSLRQAAERGFADAQYALGQMYQVGFVVPQDDAQAAKWYRLAASQGHAGAKAALAELERTRGDPSAEQP